MFLRKGVYPYKYMDDCENLMKQYYLKKIYSNLNIEDITDANYMHPKTVCKDCEMKN